MKRYLLCSVVLLCACSGGEQESEGHVWQDQTDMIDRAHEVEAMLGTANAEQRRRIEEQSE